MSKTIALTLAIKAEIRAMIVNTIEQGQIILYLVKYGEVIRKILV